MFVFLYTYSKNKCTFTVYIYIYFSGQYSLFLIDLLTCCLSLLQKYLWLNIV